MTAPRSPRDVLAALVERWVPDDDDDLYGRYVDPLLNALDREGWEIVARGEVQRLRGVIADAAEDLDYAPYSADEPAWIDFALCRLRAVVPASPASSVGADPLGGAS